MKTTTILLLAISLMFIACGDDDEEPMTNECETVDLTYTSTTASIFNKSCALSGCHTDASLAGGFSLDDYDAVFIAVGFGRIEGAINHQDGFLPMPYPAGSSMLEQCSIDQISAWIADGAPE